MAKNLGLKTLAEGVDAADLGSFGACENGSEQTNTFTASESVSGNANVTAKYFYDQSVSGSISLVIGKAPTIVMDFENHEDEEGNMLSAEDYWTFGRAAVEANGGKIRAYWNRNKELTWVYAGEENVEPTERCITAHYFNGSDPLNSRGGEESAELVSLADDEELVRKGNNSLKINYDFSNINGIEGACVGFSKPNIVIPGTPTKIGMWVYCPEGTPNLWLRIRFLDRSGTVQTLNYNDMGQKNVPFDNYIGHNVDELITYNNNSNQQVTTTIQEALGGFNWTGWKYVECDISGCQGPFTLLGGETVRVMHTYAAYGGMGNFYVQDGKLQKLEAPERKGYIVIDDVQFVYGSNTEDTDNPVVNSISAGSAELKDGAVLQGNTQSFTASFSDVENRYTSGLNYDTVNAWIDGISVPQANIFTDSSKDEAYIYDYYLAEGVHTVKFMIKDNNDNKATLTKSFVVENGDGRYPGINAYLKNSKLYLNDDAAIYIDSTDRQHTDSVQATVSFSSAFVNPWVEYADGYEEAAAPVYDAASNSMTVSAKKIDGAEVSGEGNVARVLVKIPPNVPEGSRFTYSMPKCVYNVTDAGAEAKTLSLIKLSENAGIYPSYTFEYGVLIEGLDAVLKVLDESGAPAAGVKVLNIGAEELGVTDENGEIVTDAFKTVQNVSFYAVDNDGSYSFVKTAQSYTLGANADGTPDYVKLNPVSNSESQKSVTWFSRPTVAAQKAVVQYALKDAYDAEGEAALESVEGRSEYLVFDGSAVVAENTVVYSNTVELSGLKKGGEYVYRVGDGEIWSDFHTFRTLRNGHDTKLVIIGDTQAEDVSVIDTITENIAAEGIDFGAQLGDFVEKTTLYSNWTAILNAFDDEEFKSVDFFHVTGNHELFGDEDASISGSIFNVENRLHYSATYGNVYVAVLGYSDNENELRETAAWLVEDAGSSNALWKILISHQPVYGTNEASTDCEIFSQYISAACDEAGIDFAFAGHDHAYARTNPLFAGERDDEKGTVYYTCASTGEKSYTPSNTRGIDFAFEPTNEGYTGIYLTISADEDSFEVTTRDYDGSIFDQYTKTRIVCENNIHTYVYSDDAYLTCSNCGHCEAAGDYTGKVTAESGVAMYLVGGIPETNRWIADGDEYYYLGEDGKAVTGEQTIDGIGYTFDETGKNIAGSFVVETVVNPETGESKEITRYYLGGTFVRRWNEIDGNLYYFKRTNAGDSYNEGEMYTGVRNVTTSAANTERRFTFGEDGILLIGALDDEFNTDGSYKGTRYYWGDTYLTDTTVEIEGFEYDLDSDGYVTNDPISLDDCTFTLSKTAYGYDGTEKKPRVTVTLGDNTLIRHQHYTTAYSENVEIGTATVTVTGVHGIIGEKQITYAINPAKPADVEASSPSTGAVDLTWQAVEFADGYIVYRKTEGKSFAKVGETNGETAFEDSGLVIGQEYIYVVKAVKVIDDVKYISSKSAEASVKPIINGGTAYFATATAYNTINVYWGVTDSATSYKVYRSTESDGSYKLIATVSGTSYKDTGVDIANAYFYKIVPSVKNSAGTTDGAASAVVSAKTALENAENLKASAVDGSKISLSWSKVAGATGYVVYRSEKKDSGFKKLGTTKGSASYTDGKAKPYTKYFYKVRAYRAVDGKNYYSAYTDVASAKTSLKKVTGLKAVSKSYNEIKLTWSKVAGATGYVIYRSTTKGGTFKKVGTSSTNNFVNAKVKTGTKYFYKVKAYVKLADGNRYSAYSAAVSCKAALAKAKVSSVKASGTTVTIKWGKVEGASGYVIYRSSSKNGTLVRLKKVSGASTLTWSNKNLKAGKTYYYAVKAFRTVDGKNVSGAKSARVAVKLAK